MNVSQVYTKQWHGMIPMAVTRISCRPWEPKTWRATSSSHQKGELPEVQVVMGHHLQFQRRLWFVYFRSIVIGEFLSFNSLLGKNWSWRGLFFCFFHVFSIWLYFFSALKFVSCTMCSQEPVPRRTLRDFKLPSLFSSRKPWENQDLPSRDFHCLILSRVPWPLCIPYGGKHREMRPGIASNFLKWSFFAIAHMAIWIHMNPFWSIQIHRN